MLSKTSTTDQENIQDRLSKVNLQVKIEGPSTWVRLGNKRLKRCWTLTLINSIRWLFRRRQVQSQVGCQNSFSAVLGLIICQADWAWLLWWALQSQLHPYLEIHHYTQSLIKVFESPLTPWTGLEAQLKTILSLEGSLAVSSQLSRLWMRLNLFAEV